MLLDRYLPPAYRAIFTDEFTWRDNPILGREQRREGRRRDRALLLLIFGATILAAFAFSAWALQYFHDRGVFRERVPPVLGGGYPTFFFALFSGIHVLFVWHAAYRRSYYLLLQEYRQNSLATLLCTRIPPFQMLLMASAHPFRQGMFVAAVGLPFYAWVLGMGGVPVLDFVGLYLLFAMISFRPPRWSLPVFAGIPAEEIQKRQRSGRPKTWGEWWLFNSFWILLAAGWYLQWAFGPMWIQKALRPLGDLLPASVVRVLPAFIIIWPLAIVRFLWTPLPYFGLALPPVGIILPLYLLARLMAVWESSIHLRTGDADTSQTLWDLREYWRMRRAYGVVLPFLILGLLWKPYVASGITSVLVVVNGGQRDVAVAGLLYLVGSLAALVSWARAREMSAIRAAYGGKLMSQRDGRTVELPLSAEAAYVLAPLAAIYGAFVAACLLAWTNPLPSLALRILPPLLLITLAGAYYARAIPPGLRNYLLALTGPLFGWLIPGVGGFVAAASPLAALLSLTEHTRRILDALPLYHAAPLPWYACLPISLLASALAHICFARRVSRSAAAPEPGSPYSPLPAVVPAAMALDLPRMRQAVAVEGRPSVSPVLPTAPSVASTGAVKLPPTEPAQVGKKPPGFLRKKDTPAALRFIRLIQSRWDNALAIKELRVLLRGHLGRDEQITYLVLLFTVTLIVLYRADLSAAFVEGPARLVFGPVIAGGAPMFSGGAGAAVVYGGLAAVLMLIMCIVAGAAAISICGTAFGRERDKSTLGFVLVTPLLTRSIVYGKLIGMLIPTLLAALVIWLWSAMLCIPVAAEIGVATTLAGLVYAALLLLLIVGLGGALGLATSTIFRRESDSAALSFLLLFGAITAVSFATAAWPAPMGIEFLPRQWLWLAYFVVLDLALVPALLGFTHWRVARARQGDVAFESAVK